MTAPPGLQAAANAALNLTLGSRIQVFWPLDVAWCGVWGQGARQTHVKRATCRPPCRPAAADTRGARLTGVSAWCHPPLRRYTGTITALDGMRGMVEYDDGTCAGFPPSPLHGRALSIGEGARARSAVTRHSDAWP